MQQPAACLSGIVSWRDGRALLARTPACTRLSPPYRLRPLALCACAASAAGVEVTAQTLVGVQWALASLASLADRKCQLDCLPLAIR